MLSKCNILNLVTNIHSKVLRNRDHPRTLICSNLVTKKKGVQTGAVVYYLVLKTVQRKLEKFEDLIDVRYEW